MFQFFSKHKTKREIFDSKLFNEETFYDQFITDLLNAKHIVIIESPFISQYRMGVLKPIFKSLIHNGTFITIITRDPIEHNQNNRYVATEEILECVDMGVNIKLEQGYIHRKLAIIDKTILWEGSLNILSQCSSQEMMRRINSSSIANEMLKFLKL